MKISFKTGMIILLSAVLIYTITTLVLDKTNERTSTMQIQDENYYDSIAALSQVNRDTIWLGFKFGMTRDQVNDLINEYLQTDVFKRDFDGTVLYQIKTTSYNPLEEVKVYTTFFNDSLRDVGFIITDLTDSFQKFAEIGRLYQGKYGDAKHTAARLEELKLYEKFWYFDNLKIEIKNDLTSVLVSYADAKYVRAIETEKKQEEANAELERKKGI